MNGLVLSIETTWARSSVALHRAGERLGGETSEPLAHHGESFLPMVDGLLGRLGVEPSAIEGVCVDVGPGGFTGTRVGVCVAKGIAFATGAGVVAVRSYEAIVSRHDVGVGEALLVVLPAGRGDACVWSPDRVEARLVRAGGANAFFEEVRDRADAWRLVGPMGPTFSLELGLECLNDAFPSADDVARAAVGRASTNLRQLEPAYARPPEITQKRERTLS